LAIESHVGADADDANLVGALEAADELIVVDGGRWYVAHTRSRNEKALADELGRLHIPYYLPLAQRVTRSPTTKRISRSLVPVFPGYVFFNGTEEHRQSALRTNRIAHVLHVPDQAQIVRELQGIRLLLSRQQDFSVAPQLKEGDWGRITSGPLMGLEGVVTQLSGRFRLTMNVTILGQSVSTEIERHMVEKIDPPSWLL
jgi:transcription antitermination factor NusG